MNYEMSGTQSSYGATGRGDQLFDHEDFHKERLLPSLCSKVHFVHLQKTGSKLSIPFRLFFLTIDSTFFTHWKTLAFTLSADDQLVSLIGGAFQHFLRFHWDVLCPSKTVLSIKKWQKWLKNSLRALKLALKKSQVAAALPTSCRALFLDFSWIDSGANSETLVIHNEHSGFGI